MGPRGSPGKGGPLAVGHRPTNETAVLGLMGSIIEPMPRAAARFVVADGSNTHIEAAR